MAQRNTMFLSYFLFVCMCVLQRTHQSGGSGREAGRPDRIPETAQHVAEQEAAEPHCSALTSLTSCMRQPADHWLQRSGESTQSLYCSERRAQRLK